MATTGHTNSYFPRRLILAASLISGMLLALAAHMLGQSVGLDIGLLWRHPAAEGMPATAALAWWAVAGAAFVGSFMTARAMDNAVSGEMSGPMVYLLGGALIFALAAAGQAAAGPSSLPTLAGVISGIVAVALGTIMAFCGAHFALRYA